MTQSMCQLAAENGVGSRSYFGCVGAEKETDTQKQKTQSAYNIKERKTNLAFVYGYQKAIDSLFDCSTKALGPVTDETDHFFHHLLCSPL